jgi:hypothetical protein
VASDAPAFEPLNALEGLLMRAATEPDQRRAFTEALLTEQLYVVTPDDRPDGDQVLGADTRISLAMVPLEDGGAATAVFTAAERVAQIYGVGSRYIALKGRDLIEMVSANPMLLNPGLAYGVLWSPDDLAMLLGKPVEHEVGEDTQLMLGTPAQRPDQLIMRLAEAFHPEAGVEAVWLALAQWPGREDFAWYLDVRSDLPRDRLRDLLTRALDGADLRGLHLDMSVQPTGGAPGTGIAVVEPR